MKLISYIFPIYNEGGNIPLLYETVTEVVQAVAHTYQFEFIFIDDGSKDDSLSVLYKIQEKDPRVRVFSFARNYGHQIAVTAGIDYARGDAAIIMDSDLQDPPAVSLELIRKWEEGYNVAYAQRRSRKDTWFKRVTAHMFYRTLQKLSEVEIPRNTGDFRLIDRIVMDQLKLFKEHSRFLRGMVSYVGYKQIAVPFDRDERHTGTSGYPLAKMLRFAADGILSFSSSPIRAISRIGISIAVLSLLGILYALIVFFMGHVIPGWTFTVISIFFIGGVQLTMLGVLGSYIGRIYTEVQNRPLYSVASVKETPRDD